MLRATLPLLAAFFLSLAVLGPAPAAAKGSTHVQSAFTFAERRDWNNARSHARASGDAALLKFITWEYLLDQDSGASFNDYMRFLDANPDWPEQKKLRLRAEMSLKDSNVADHDLVAWFSDDAPITGVGKMALAEALERSNLGSPGRVISLIREGWKGGDFDEAQEKQILAAHGAQITTDDDIARTDRLLWEEKTGPAKRMLPRLPETYQKLFKARIWLIEDKRLAVLEVALVPSALKEDPGLIYDRMRYRARRGDDDGVRDLLLDTPREVPYPDKWWKYREQQIREAIDERNYSMAQKLLYRHGQSDGTGLADALWLQGWLLTEFLNRPQDGYDVFYRMYDNVKYPVSRARAAYWAGRAAEKAGDRDTATGWYQSASAYPTAFYGQLAAHKLKPGAPLDLPPPPHVSETDRQEFDRTDIARAIKLAADNGDNEMAGKLAAWLAENAATEKEAALAAGLGNRVGHPYVSVHAAKKAQRQKVLFIDASYPSPKIPVGLAVEKPLALAISRQESEFDLRAKSPSGALGLMQLLPKTAKEIARKRGLQFSAARLYETAYNLTLGSAYLDRLIDSYDGSLVMAIAAYNAGPGNVRGWVRQFGTPNNDMENAVNWIEKIPFPETRNYVQRVMENLQVYRQLSTEKKPQPLKLAEDLAR